MHRSRISLRKLNGVKGRFTVRLLIVFALSCASLLAIAGNPETLSTRDLAVTLLGHQLFSDGRLSSTRTVSCATCHVPEKAFSDGIPIAIGVNGQRGTRNTPSLWNARDLPSLFWDGRQSKLEKQAMDPLLNPREHGLPDKHALLAIIRGDPKYRSAFQSAFGISADKIKTDHITVSLAAFQRTLVTDDSAFDRYYFSKMQSAMPDSAIRGLELFKGRARCANCHTIDEKNANFTDHQFHSLGISLGGILPRLTELTQRVVKADATTLDRLVTENADIAALGRFVLTKDPRDIGKFRTPSLRNVALTAPYMHDGSVATLEGSVDSEIYYRSIESGRPLILTPREKADLVALLTSLTSPNAVNYPTAADGAK